MEDKYDGCVKFGFVGCGAIAKKHITAINRIPNTRIVGAFDIDCENLKKIERVYGLPCFQDLDQMICETGPQVLNILTPSGLHGANILELVKYKKDFVVEKPLALRLEEIDQILNECDRGGMKIFVVQQNRFNPPIQKAKEALLKGRFGKLVLGTVRVRWCREQHYYDEKTWRGTWGMDGGVLTNQASHHIDMLIWMMGEVESVMAKIETRLVSIEAEDTGLAILRFRNGALGVIEATTGARPRDLEGSISILGEKGAVEIGGYFMNELKTWNFREKDEMDEDIFRSYGKVPQEEAWNHTEFYKNVVKSIQEGGKGLIDGLEGRKSVELINAIYESAELGKEVFLRFRPKRCKLGGNNGK